VLGWLQRLQELQDRSMRQAVGPNNPLLRVMSPAPKWLQRGVALILVSAMGVLFYLAVRDRYASGGVIGVVRFALVAVGIMMSWWRNRDRKPRDEERKEGH